MVAQFVAALERPVSRVRLESYRDGGTDFDMVVNYFFNLELSEALYPTLQAFEIVLRNSVHLTLSRHFSSSYWFDTTALYPPPPPPARTPWQENTLRAARERLTQEKKPHDANRIVAELHFGFWHAMFNRPFERSLWRPNRAELIEHVFPGIPVRLRNRQDVWKRIDHIRIIRNRVMHYEPIWQRPRLRDDHASILEALRWISLEMHESIAMCDRFSAVMGGRALTEARVALEIQRRYPSPRLATD